jgi:uncharacterized protein (TIGR03000 family)
MSKRWLSAVLGVAALGGLPAVSSAQTYSPGGYSPYYYLRHGSYYEPNMYSAPGTSPGNFAGTAMAVYGDAYSPYDYLKHGSYSWPHPGSSSYYFPLSRAVMEPPAYSYGTPSYAPYYYSRSTTSTGAGEEQDAALSEGRASVRVRVPEKAEIWFEGEKTSQTGAVRNFLSPALERGKNFTYEVRARWTDDAGKVVERTQQVKVRAGGRSTADFTTPEK